MIYFFSGTGNSYYAAQKLARLTGDKCVNIASIFKGTVSSVSGKGDVTGFVFPVYFSGLPEIVKRFASHPEIRSHLGSYVYCVITCGAEMAAADKKLENALGREIDFSIKLKMPDNYVIAYDPSDPETAKERIREADAKLDKIAEVINQRGRYRNPDFKKDLLTAVMYPFYNLFRTTLLFRADNNCIGCGKCESVCPDRVITIKNGKPVWTKSRCQHCTACINRCPQKAIQFGVGTAKRGRYYIMNISGNSDKED